MLPAQAQPTRGIGDQPVPVRMVDAAGAGLGTG